MSQLIRLKRTLVDLNFVLLLLSSLGNSALPLRIVCLSGWLRSRMIQYNTYKSLLLLHSRVWVNGLFVRDAISIKSARKTSMKKIL